LERVPLQFIISKKSLGSMGFVLIGQLFALCCAFTEFRNEERFGRGDAPAAAGAGRRLPGSGLGGALFRTNGGRK
jgi:hypothetical protein